MNSQVIRDSRKYLMGIFICLVMLLLFDTKVFADTTIERKTPKGEYVLYVNKELNSVTVCRVIKNNKEIVIKTMICSCGANGNTPKGTFKTSDYYEWRNMLDGSWGRYAVRFNGHILFHSVPYTRMSPDSLEWDQYNLLGEDASMGCVRLSVKDAKWIYDHCEKGTKVVVYEDSDQMGPYKRPEAIKIDENSPNRGWDPTDPDEENPWNKEETNLKNNKYKR